MEREPGIERDDAAEAVARDDGLAWVATLPPNPVIPFTEEEVAASVARARVGIAAGRGVSAGDVARWTAALGTTNERPMPPEWLP